MRNLVLALTAAGLMACEPQVKSDQPAIEGKQAAISYEGSNYRTPAAKLAHGERMSWMMGCKGCHGDNLQGNNVTKNEPEMGDWWAPNVTLMLAEYSDAEWKR